MIDCLMHISGLTEYSFGCYYFWTSNLFTYVYFLYKNLKMKKNIKPIFLLILGLLTLHLTAIAQPQMTLWEVDHMDHNASILYTCGSEYYHTRPAGEPEVSSHWSIKNEGDETLNISLPLTLTGPGATRFEIIQQPGNASLEPGEETIFIISYSGPSNSDEASLIINSDSGSNGSCELEINGGFFENCIFDKTWTGLGDGTTWEDGANWDAGVPVAGDVVQINIANDVTLSSIADITTLSLAATATLTINLGAELSFSGNPDCFPSDGIIMEDNSQITNNGTILMNLNSDYSDGFDINDNTSLINNGSITVNNAENEGIDIDDSPSIMNNGSIIIDSPGSEAIEMDESAIFTNVGTLVTNNPDFEGLEMDDSSSFINIGTFTINNPGTEGIDFDDSESRFVNNGTLNINDLLGDDEALEIDDGIFTNTGVINITGVIFDESILIEAAGTLMNELCGIINIEEGIIEIDSDAAFTNDGIFATGTPAGNDNAGIFTNNSQIVTPTGDFEIDAALVGAGEVVAGAVPVLVSLCVEPVPTMGEWALIILLLLLSIFGVSFITQKSNQEVALDR